MRRYLFVSLALALPLIRAHPASRNSKTHLTKRIVDLKAFSLKVASKYTDSASVESNARLSVSSRGSPQDTASELVKKTVPGANFRLVESVPGSAGVTHVYFRQTANELDIVNADFNVNIGRDGEVLTFGNTFYMGDIASAPDLKKRDEVDPADALKGAVNVLQLPVQADQATAEPKGGKGTYAIKNTRGAIQEPEAQLVYIHTSEGELALTWKVETDIWTNWLLSYVDAHDPEKVHAVVDYSAAATYEVYPWPLSNPAEGERVIETDPFLEEASEFGWHSTGTEEFDTTWGNNAIAHLWRDSDSEEDYENKPRPSDPDLNFQYPYSPEEEDWEGYGNASVTQLFYTTNKYHDLLYLLGFTEAAGNFEANNNGAGGQGNDMVLLDAQDTTSKNNGAFATPPDGSPGRITLYMFDRNGLPERDPSFDAAVVIHEYTHGVSNRLTGGPANAQCLSLPEARGMGEGWSDFMAIALRLKVGDTRDTDYPLGDWVSKDPLGIRRYLYSTDMTTNPHVYEDLDLLLIVEHAMGTVWATMLYEVLWNLIDKHGKNDNPVPEFDSNGVPTDGKYLTMKLVLDGMKLQPCNPTFPVARDAILDADLVLSGGDNACQIWSGFAKRGLGEGAVYDFWNRTQSFDIPEGVC